MSYIFNLNILKLLYHYIRVAVINDLITLFLNFKDILKFIINIKSINYLLNFNYKKLFIVILKQLKSDIYDIIKVFNEINSIIKYIINKYLLYYSFSELCIKYIKDSNINNLKLHIFNKLDIILICKNKLKFILKFIQSFIVYLVDKYYYNFNTFDFIIKYITDKNYNTFFKTCYKLQQYLKIEQFKFSLKEELWDIRSFLKPSLYKNYTADENLDLIYSLNLT